MACSTPEVSEHNHVPAYERCIRVMECQQDQAQEKLEYLWETKMGRNEILYARAARSAWYPIAVSDHEPNVLAGSHTTIRAEI